jgi:hypothetical protein
MMISRFSGFARVLTAGLTIGALALPSAAQAYWRGGVWIGVGPVVPYYPPAPVYVPPPVVYAPPPVYYPPPAPPAATPVGYGYMCYAGNYTCALPAQGPVGSVCSCPGIGAPSYGTIH